MHYYRCVYSITHGLHIHGIYYTVYYANAYSQYLYGNKSPVHQKMSELMIIHYTLVRDVLAHTSANMCVHGCVCVVVRYSAVQRDKDSFIVL